MEEGQQQPRGDAAGAACSGGEMCEQQPDCRAAAVVSKVIKRDKTAAAVPAADTGEVEASNFAKYTRTKEAEEASSAAVPHGLATAAAATLQMCMNFPAREVPEREGRRRTSSSSSSSVNSAREEGLSTSKKNSTDDSGGRNEENRNQKARKRVLSWDRLDISNTSNRHTSECKGNETSSDNDDDDDDKAKSIHSMSRDLMGAATAAAAAEAKELTPPNAATKATSEAEATAARTGAPSANKEALAASTAVFSNVAANAHTAVTVDAAAPADASQRSRGESIPADDDGDEGDGGGGGRAAGAAETGGGRVKVSGAIEWRNEISRLGPATQKRSAEAATMGQGHAGAAVDLESDGSTVVADPAATTAGIGEFVTSAVEGRTSSKAATALKTAGKRSSIRVMGIQTDDVTEAEIFLKEGSKNATGDAVSADGEAATAAASSSSRREPHENASIEDDADISGCAGSGTSGAERRSAAIARIGQEAAGAADSKTDSNNTATRGKSRPDGSYSDSGSDDNTSDSSSGEQQQTGQAKPQQFGAEAFPFCGARLRSRRAVKRSSSDSSTEENALRNTESSSGTPKVRRVNSSRSGRGGVRRASAGHGESSGADNSSRTGVSCTMKEGDARMRGEAKEQEEQRRKEVNKWELQRWRNNVEEQVHTKEEEETYFDCIAHPCYSSTGAEETGPETQSPDVSIARASAIKRTSSENREGKGDDSSTMTVKSARTPGTAGETKSSAEQRQIKQEHTGEVKAKGDAFAFPGRRWGGRAAEGLAGATTADRFRASEEMEQNGSFIGVSAACSTASAAAASSSIRSEAGGGGGPAQTHEGASAGNQAAAAAVQAAFADDCAAAAAALSEKAKPYGAGERLQAMPSAAAAAASKRRVWGEGGGGGGNGRGESDTSSDSSSRNRHSGTGGEAALQQRVSSSNRRGRTLVRRSSSHDRSARRSGTGASGRTTVAGDRREVPQQERTSSSTEASPSRSPGGVGTAREGRARGSAEEADGGEAAALLQNASEGNHRGIQADVSAALIPPACRNSSTPTGSPATTGARSARTLDALSRSSSVVSSTRFSSRSSGASTSLSSRGAAGTAAAVVGGASATATPRKTAAAATQVGARSSPGERNSNKSSTAAGSAVSAEDGSVSSLSSTSAGCGDGSAAAVSDGQQETTSSGAPAPLGASEGSQDFHSSNHTTSSLTTASSRHYSSAPFSLCNSNPEGEGAAPLSGSHFFTSKERKNMEEEGNVCSSKSTARKGDGVAAGSGAGSALGSAVAVSSVKTVIDEGRTRSTTVHIGAGHQVPALPSFFLDCNWLLGYTCSCAATAAAALPFPLYSENGIREERDANGDTESWKNGEPAAVGRCGGIAAAGERGEREKELEKTVDDVFPSFVMGKDLSEGEKKRCQTAAAEESTERIKKKRALFIEQEGEAAGLLIFEGFWGLGRTMLCSPAAAKAAGGAATAAATGDFERREGMESGEILLRRGLWNTASTSSSSFGAGFTPPTADLLDSSLTARLVYSPSALERIRTKRLEEGRTDRAIASDEDMGTYLRACARRWKNRPGWQPFSPEFAFKLLHFAAYDPIRALQILDDPQFSFRDACDPPTRKYDNKWKPKDRRGTLPTTPYPPPVSMRSLLARRQQLGAFAKDSLYSK